MPLKRKLSRQKTVAKRARTATKYTARKTKTRPLKKFARKVRSALQSIAETKNYLFNTNDGTQYTHMGLGTLKGPLFGTTQSVSNAEAAANGITVGYRIGDRIEPKACTVRLYIQNNERFGEVQYKLWFVRGRGTQATTQPNAGTFFRGMSDNKMLDEVNSEYFTVLASKSFTIKAAQPGVNTNNASQVNYSGTGSGTYCNGLADHDAIAFIPGSKIIKWKLPMPKIISYVNNSSDVQGGLYWLMFMPYVVRNTSSAQNVCEVNDMSIHMTYTDV